LNLIPSAAELASHINHRIINAGNASFFMKNPGKNNMDSGPRALLLSIQLYIYSISFLLTEQTAVNISL